ncbi:hypothetical protein BY996DRAFT_6591466 [Phakopsora pachyrhizi]|nr:hypothetical protein BY996DRAFT_6591466 [Phakopsora pachyrhizi]
MEREPLTVMVAPESKAMWLGVVVVVNWIDGVGSSKVMAKVEGEKNPVLTRIVRFPIAALVTVFTEIPKLGQFCRGWSFVSKAEIGRVVGKGVVGAVGDHVGGLQLWIEDAFAQNSMIWSSDLEGVCWEKQWLGDFDVSFNKMESYICCGDIPIGGAVRTSRKTLLISEGMANPTLAKCVEVDICIKRLMIKLPASSNIPKNVFGLLKALMKNFCKAYIKTGLGTCQLQLSLFEQAEEDLGMYQDTTSRIEISNLNNRVRMAALDATLTGDYPEPEVIENLPNRSWIELLKGSKLAAALLGLKLLAGMVEDLSKEVEGDPAVAKQQTWSDSINSNNRSTNNNSICKNCVKHKTKKMKLIGLGQTVIAIWKKLWKDLIRPEQPKSLSVGQNLEELQRMADLRTVSEKDCRWIEPTSRHKWMDFSVVRAS